MLHEQCKLQGECYWKRRGVYSMMSLHLHVLITINRSSTHMQKTTDSILPDFGLSPKKDFSVIVRSVLSKLWVSRCVVFVLLQIKCF